MVNRKVAVVVLDNGNKYKVGASKSFRWPPVVFRWSLGYLRCS